MGDLIGDLIDILRIDGDRWRALANGLDRALLARPPAPGEWSALQCLGHAADTEAFVFTARIRAMRDGRPELPSYDPDTQATPITEATDPAVLAERLATQRRDSLALLATLRDEDLDRTSRHLELGPVTMRELLNEWAAHDMMHIVQAERAVMQPFIPASGPWRFYFAGHDVEAAETQARQAAPAPLGGRGLRRPSAAAGSGAPRRPIRDRSIQAKRPGHRSA